MLKFELRTSIALLLLSACVNAEDAEFSYTSGELKIPVVNVGSDRLYSVRMLLMDDKDDLLFNLIEAEELFSSAERFESVNNGMTRQEVIAILGVPQKIKNLEKKLLAFCSEPLLEVGAQYEQWEYDVDASEQEPSGYVVWFSKTDSTAEWKTVGKVEGFVCM